MSRLDAALRALLPLGLACLPLLMAAFMLASAGGPAIDPPAAARRVG